MSVTETQVIHNFSQTETGRLINARATTTSSSIMNSGSGFILSNDHEDANGLKLSLDKNLGGRGGTLVPLSGNRLQFPVSSPSQFCGLSSVSGWMLRALSYFHSAHLTFISFITYVNGSIQQKIIHILPLCLYLSLLVLTIQGAVILILLSQSLLPLGMWFLMTCISTMGAIFCSTIVTTTEHYYPTITTEHRSGSRSLQ